LHGADGRIVAAIRPNIVAEVRIIVCRHQQDSLRSRAIVRGQNGRRLLDGNGRRCVQLAARLRRREPLVEGLDGREVIEGDRPLVLDDVGASAIDAIVRTQAYAYIRLEYLDDGQDLVAEWRPLLQIEDATRAINEDEHGRNSGFEFHLARIAVLGLVGARPAAAAPGVTDVDTTDISVPGIYRPNICGVAIWSAVALRSATSNPAGPRYQRGHYRIHAQARRSSHKHCQG